MKLFIRKKTKKQSIFSWLMFHLHLWLGLLSAISVFVLCFTGAAVVFRPQLIELTNYSKAFNSKRFEEHCSIEKIMEDYEATFGEKPAKIEIPKSAKKNIKALTSGRYPTITYYDRETGEMLGETTGGYAKFMTFMMNGHRRLFLGHQSETGKFIISWSNVIFLFLVISGIILWFPKGRKQMKARFKVKLPRKFRPANYLIHVNWGFYATLGLLVLIITGIFFSFRNIQRSTVEFFRTDEEISQAANTDKKAKQVVADLDAMYEHALTNPDTNTVKSVINYDKLVVAANQELNYSGNLEIMIPKWNDELITIRKKNNHNWLGAVLTDNVYLNRDAQVQASVLFKDLSLSTKINSFIRPLHTGEILGLKTQILYFFLCLLGAWLTISGFIMWWTRVKPKKKKNES